MIQQLRGTLLAVLLALALNSCGYHMVGHGDGAGGAIPADVTLLSLAGNAKPAVLVALRQRLQSDRYAIVEANGVEANTTGDETTFAMLYVTVSPLVFTPSTFDTTGIATQYRMIFSGSLLLERQGETIWQSGMVQRQGDVFVSAEPTSIEASRERLLADLRKQWLSDAIGRIRSGF